MLQLSEKMIIRWGMIRRGSKIRYIAGIDIKVSPEPVTIFGIRISIMLSYYDRFVFTVNTLYFSQRDDIILDINVLAFHLMSTFFIIILDRDKFSQKTINIRHLKSAFLS